MYPAHNLYQLYRTAMGQAPFSIGVFDQTKRFTLERLNFAINVCERWEHAMDIGGGNGHYLAALAKKFARTTLVEVSHFPEHDTFSSTYPKTTIVRSLIEDYRGDGSADFILLADLFEHIPNIASFVNRLNTLQPVGGVVYIMTPNPLYCGPAPESGIYHTHHPYGHQKHYTQREIITLMAQAGYELETFWYEETPTRQRGKRIISGLTRRDQSWRTRLWYKPVRPLLVALSAIVSNLLGRLAYRSEQANQQNPFVTLTQDLVFKKRQ